MNKFFEPPDILKVTITGIDEFLRYVNTHQEKIDPSNYCINSYTSDEINIYHVTELDRALLLKLLPETAASVYLAAEINPGMTPSLILSELLIPPQEEWFLGSSSSPITSFSHHQWFPTFGAMMKREMSFGFVGVLPNPKYARNFLFRNFEDAEAYIRLANSGQL